MRSGDASLPREPRLPEDGWRPLLEALRSHHPLGAREQDHLEAISRLLEVHGDRSFDRSLFTPGHLTSSAFVVFIPGRTVLLHHHRKLGIWLQLGGHDEGERNPWKTALREAREESGLDDLDFLDTGILDVDIHEVPRSGTDPAHLHHDIRFAMKTSSPGAAQHDHAESLDMRWCSFAEAMVLMNEGGSRRALARMERLLGV